MLVIGIVGFGVVGSALKHYLREKHGKEIQFRIRDPFKNLQDDLSDCQCIFICVPVPTLENRSQDLEQLDHALNAIKQSGFDRSRMVIIRSTILPGTTDLLRKREHLNIVHMPEFLTERFAIADMTNYDLICGIESMTLEGTKLLEILFSGKQIHFMRNEEAELAKYAHNAFAAMKINFFNLIRSVAIKQSLDYGMVLKGVWTTGFIGTSHTQVPGHDGKKGYGGKCLPKDLAAFINFLETQEFKCDSLKQVEIENKEYRG